MVTYELFDKLVEKAREDKHPCNVEETTRMINSMAMNSELHKKHYEEMYAIMIHYESIYRQSRGNCHACSTMKGGRGVSIKFRHLDPLLQKMLREYVLMFSSKGPVA